MSTEYKPRPAVAALLSIAWPGLGYAYCDRPGLTAMGFGLLLVVLVAAEFLLMGSFAGLVAVFVIAGLLQLGMIVHSATIAAYSPPKPKRIINRWYLLLLVAVGAAIGLPAIWRESLRQIARYQTYRSQTTAMQPTILAGDRVVVDRWAYRTTSPARGHLLMFTAPDMPGVRRMERCVAIPGDTVAIRDKVLLINGESVLETFAVHRDPDIVRTSADAVRDNLPETNLAPGQFFMLADDRDASVDSRYFGPIKRTSILGRVVVIYWSRAGSNIGTQF